MTIKQWSGELQVLADKIAKLVSPCEGNYGENREPEKPVRPMDFPLADDKMRLAGWSVNRA